MKRMPLSEIQEYLKRVHERAKELYELSNQGKWEDLPEALQRMWIRAASEEIKEKDDAARS